MLEASGLIPIMPLIHHERLNEGSFFFVPLFRLYCPYTVKLWWLEHRWLVYHGLFELIFESLRNFSDSSSKQTLRETFLFYYEIVCCVNSLELPHRDNSNEYTQHTIILLKRENISINYRHLLPDLVPWLNLIGSNYPSLEQISTVPKMFEPLKFDCTKW